MLYIYRCFVMVLIYFIICFNISKYMKHHEATTENIVFVVTYCYCDVDMSLI